MDFNLAKKHTRMANTPQRGRNKVARSALVHGQLFEHFSLESGEGTKTRRGYPGACGSYLCCEVQPRPPSPGERCGCGASETRQFLDRVQITEWRDERRRQGNVQCIVIDRLKETAG